MGHEDGATGRGVLSLRSLYRAFTGSDYMPTKVVLNKILLPVNAGKIIIDRV